LIFFKSDGPPDLLTGRPRIEAAVAAPGDLPRDTIFFITFFFTVTTKIYYGQNYDWPMLQRGGNVSKRAK
jgi:hypothetical protein